MAKNKQKNGKSGKTMKTCRYCGKEVKDDVQFCPECGANMYSQPPASPAGAAQDVTGSVTTGQPEPTGQPEKKKSTTGILVALVLTGVCMLGGLFASVISYEAAADKQQKIAGQAQDSVSPTQGTVPTVPDITLPDISIPETPYSEGTRSTEGYVNEWADLKITVPDNYEPFDDDRLKDGDQEYATRVFGMDLQADDAFQFMDVDLWDLTEFSDGFTISAEDFLKVIYDDDIDEESESLQFFGATLGGQAYAAADFQYMYEGIPIYSTVYTKKVGSYAIVITVTGQSFEAAHALAEACVHPFI